MRRALAVLALAGVMAVPASAAAQSPSPSALPLPSPVASIGPAYTSLADFLTGVIPIIQDVSNSAGVNDLQDHAGDISAGYIVFLLTIDPAPCYQDFYVKNWMVAALLNALDLAPRKDTGAAFRLVNRALDDVGGSLPTGTDCL